MQKRGEYFDVQLAVDGVLSVGQEVHASAREQFHTEESWMQYLIRSAQTLIALFGDARDNKVIPEQEMAAA